MEEKQERKTLRDEFADKFISILESDSPLEWTKGWRTGAATAPYNGQTGRKYHGVNRLILMFSAMEKGYTDPRYYTFHQVSQMDGCKVRSGEKATAVEYWLVWDSKEKRSMTFGAYEALIRQDPSRKEEEFRAYAKAAYVFNAAQVEGLQPLPRVETALPEADQLADEVIRTMSENMGVQLIYGGDEAYYSPATDTIHLPPEDAFFSAAERIGTTLHELAHATSAPSRLNRPIVGYHQDPDRYAMEELRAEIASTFASGEIGSEIPDCVVKNHLAYVSSWLKQIRQDKRVLFTAIREADTIADYMVQQGRVETLKEKLTVAARMPKQLQGISYEIWQLKDTEENRALRFADYGYASLFRLTESRYDKVYEAQAGADDYTLDRIYCKFNTNRPSDFTGHSLSVSDVVVLKIEGQRTAWYCDSFGFREVPGFCLSQQHSQTKGRRL